MQAAAFERRRPFSVMILSIFFIVAVFCPAASTQNLRISLNTIDSAYIVHGSNLMSTYKQIIITGPGLIYVNFWTDNAANAKVTWNDGTTTLNAKDFKAQFMQPNITVNFANVLSFNFVLSFSATTQTETTPNYPYQHSFLVFDADHEGYTSSIATADIPVAMSFINYTTTDPAFDVWLTTLSPNCTSDLFLGGVPLEDGYSKYRLFHYNASHFDRFYPSSVLGPVATLLIPPRCNITFQVRAVGTFETPSSTNSSGFFMSRNYPGNFIAASNNPSTEFIFEKNFGGRGVAEIQVLGGSLSQQGYCYLAAGNVDLNTTSLTSPFQISGIGKSLKIRWIDPTSPNGFLLNYFVELSDDTKSSSVLYQSLFLPVVSLVFVSLQ